VLVLVLVLTLEPQDRPLVDGRRHRHRCLALEHPVTGLHEQRRVGVVALLVGALAVGERGRVDEPEPEPQLVAQLGLGEHLPRHPVELDVGHLGIALEAHRVDPATDLLVGDVVDEDRPAREARRVEQVLEVAPDPLGGVVAVDEGEVRRPPRGGELAQERGKELVGAPRVQDHVVGDGQRRRE